MHAQLPFSRRSFLLTAGVFTAGLAGGARGADAAPALKAAVIGLTGRGDYGHGLDLIFQGRPGIELVALADPDAEGRRKAAARIQAPRQYADFGELLERERPRLVSVAMRQSDQHHAIVRAALRAGAHVYCEKPFVTAPAESDDLLAEAGRRGLRIAVAHTLRMKRELVRFRQAVRDGLLGELVEARAYGKQDARAGGEDMMVLGTHLFDLLRLFLGDPEWVSARVTWQGRDITARDGRLVKDNVGLVAGDQVLGQFTFPGGVQASFTSAGRLRETVGPWGIELLGSKGAARIACDLGPLVYLRRGAAPWKTEGKSDKWEPFDPGPAPGPAPANLNVNPVTDWLEAISAGREPECSGRNGAWAVEMVMGIYRAALGGGRVKFPLPDRGHPLVAGGG